MSTENNTRVLDFCRVKKIFERGFGFLSSLYYEENVFFHFNKIKNEEAKSKLENLKRGEVYLFYTSEPKGEKRRAVDVWLDLKKVDQKLLPDFVNKIIETFEIGKTNPFELAHVVKMLREDKYLSEDNFKKILLSQRFLRNPSIVKAMFNEDELGRFPKLDAELDKLEEEKISGEDFAEMILKGLTE